MTPNTPPPRGLRWAGGTLGNIIAYAVAAGSIVLSLYVFSLYQDLAKCTAEAQRQDARRTAILAPYTDAERRADRLLLIGPTAGGPDLKTLRLAALDAREQTDRARAVNPPPAGPACGV